MDIQKTALRVPKDLHKKIIEAANANGHSMNAEIISRLRASFEDKLSGSESNIREIVRDEIKKHSSG